MKTLLALSVKPPWGELIVTGQKRVEVRSWRPPTSFFGKTIAIHTGKQFDGEAPPSVHAMADQYLREVPPVPVGKFDLLDDPYFTMAQRLGGIIGFATLKGCIQFTQESWRRLQPQHLNELSWWRAELWGWEFTEPQRLPHFIHYKGELGLFDIPFEKEDLENAINA